MSSSRSVANPGINRSPIRAWRIVGGAFLHFAVPAYVVIVAILTLFDAPADTSLGSLARLALGYSGWFLAGYAALAVTATAVAAAAEPLFVARRRHREAGDPALSATASRLRVTRAIADARSIAGADLGRLLDSIGAPRWDHDDSRFQVLSLDFLQVVQVMATANATASVKSRPEIIDLATRSLQRIDDRLGEFAAERSRLDQGDAHAVARYVENRYGPSDFTGS